MRHQKTRHKLSRTSAHRKALLANLCKEVIQHERIKTSEAKAKAVKPEVEQLITLAKRGDLHARRQALAAPAQPDERVAAPGGSGEEWVVAGVDLHDAGCPAGELALPVGRGAPVL